MSESIHVHGPGCCDDGDPTPNPLDYAIFLCGDSPEETITRLCATAREYALTLPTPLPKELYALWQPDLGMVLWMSDDKEFLERSAKQYNDQRLPLNDGSPAKFIVTPIPTENLIENENLASIVPNNFFELGGKTESENRNNAKEFVKSLKQQLSGDLAAQKAEMPPVMYVMWCADQGIVQGATSDLGLAKYSAAVLTRRGIPGPDGAPMKFGVLEVETD